MDYEGGEHARISIPQYNLEFHVKKGSTILEALREKGIGIRSVCGGKGFCGKCKVIVRRGKVEHRVRDKEVISVEELSKGYVLACQAKIIEDIEITIPHESIMGKAKLLADFMSESVEVKPYTHKIIISKGNIHELKKILSEYKVACEEKWSFEELFDKILEDNATLIVNSYLKEIVKIEFAKKVEKFYGLAVDVGTTKIVASIIDMINGNILATESEFNKQLVYGEDLMSRISYAMEIKDGLKELQKAVVDTINELVKRLCGKLGVNANEICEVAIAGNTVMTYTTIGLNPSPLVKSFKERVNIPRNPYTLHAKDLGLKLNGNTPIYVLPCAGRFFGGDVIGDIITSRLSFQEQPSILIDIGTNTEVVIGCRDWVLGTTAPAGPAFEGWGLKCGVRAIEGAIESIKIDSETLKAHYNTIGGAKPIGICGSGYIDLLAELFINGVIDVFGKFRRDIESQYIRLGADGYEYVVASKDETSIGRDIVITEKDIYNLIDAKSSVCAAISILLKKMLMNVNDVRKVYICGAFGKYLNVNNAIAIGMIPEFTNAEIIYIGNGSLGGSYLSLISKDYREEAERISKIVAIIELLLDPDFMDEYQAGFVLPGKRELFPTWWEASRKIRRK